MDDGYFAEHSVVEINVPDVSDLDIEEALGAPEPEGDDSNPSLIPSVPRRTLLYFDETLEFYVVVRVPREDEEALKSRITRLSISVEARALNDPSLEAPPSKDGAPQEDVIWSGKLDVREEPTVVMEESSEDGDVATALLIWKMSAVLHRPRLRLTQPVILWSAHALLEPPTQKRRKAPSSKYLTSGVPLPINLFSAVESGSTKEGQPPYLSADRVLRSSRPASQTPARPMALKLLSTPTFRALPAFTSRIRFHRSHQLGDVPTIAASLELDVPASAPAEVELLSVELDLARGNADLILPEYSIKTPRMCKPRETLVFLYMFSPLRTIDDPMANALTTHLLEVSIKARVKFSEVCKPSAHIKWRTSVDFSNAQKTLRKNLDPIVKPPIDADGQIVQTNLPSPDYGPENPEYTVSFVPDSKGPCYVGEPFKWQVMVVNRTPRPVHLALTVIQKRRTPQGGGSGPGGKQARHSHHSSTGSITAVSKSGAVADAFVDDNLLYASLKAGGPEQSQLLCLSADVKVGPLATGAAGQAVLEFLPLAKGWLAAPEAVRLTDMATGEHCDIRQMPDVVVLERKGQEGETAPTNGGLALRHRPNDDAEQDATGDD